MHLTKENCASFILAGGGLTKAIIATDSLCGKVTFITAFLYYAEEDVFRHVTNAAEYHKEENLLRLVPLEYLDNDATHLFKYDDGDQVLTDTWSVAGNNGVTKWNTKDFNSLSLSIEINSELITLMSAIHSDRLIDMSVTALRRQHSTINTKDLH